MMIELRKTFAPPTEEELKQFEREFGAELPDPYREFLLAYGGGAPKGDSFFPVAGTPFGFSYFMPLSGNQNDNLRDARACGYFPTTMVPFAISNNADYWLLCLKGVDVGKVFYWRHDQGVDMDDEYEWFDMAGSDRSLVPDSLKSGSPDWAELLASPLFDKLAYTSLTFIAGSFEEFLSRLVVEPAQADLSFTDVFTECGEDVEKLLSVLPDPLALDDARWTVPQAICVRGTFDDVLHLEHCSLCFDWAEAVHFAVQNRNRSEAAQIVGHLLDQGADPNTPSPRNSTAPLEGAMGVYNGFSREMGNHLRDPVILLLKRRGACLPQGSEDAEDDFDV